MWDDGYFTTCFVITHDYWFHLLVVELIDGDRLALRVLRLADGGWDN